MWKGSETTYETNSETREKSYAYETIKRKETSPAYSSVYPRANRNNIQPPPDIEEGEEVYEVEQILKHRKCG
jgi:hypothetical protein